MPLEPGAMADADQEARPPPGAAAAAEWLAPMSRATGVLCAVATLVALCCDIGTLGIAPHLSSAEDSAVFRSAVLMSVPALLLEGARALAAVTSGFERCGDHWANMLLLLQFVVKFSGYLVMWLFGGGIVHANLRSPEPRAVYTIRWMDWAITVPILVTVSNSAFESAEHPLPQGRLTPALIANVAMVFTSWAGQIVSDPIMGWGLTALSTFAWLLTIVEQVLFVVERHRLVPYAKFKIAAIAAKEVYFAAYGCVMLFDNFGLMTSYQVQLFYTYSDVLLKALASAVMAIIRNWENIEFVHNTLRSKAEKAEADMFAMISKASVPIVCLDPSGVVTGWNQRISTLTGINEIDAVGQLLSDLTTEDCHQELGDALRTCVDGQAGGSTGVVELVVRSPERSSGAHMTMNFISRLGDGGQLGSIVAVGQDLTELIASKSMQERRMKFTAMVSHELKSPLHGIMGLGQSLLEAAKDDVEKKQLGMICGCGTRMLDLVTNIMDQASIDNKPSSQQGPAKSLPVNLLDIVDEVISLTKAAVNKAGRPLLSEEVELINNATMQTIPVVRGDPYKCTQLVYNLVTNACKFTKEGHVAVSITYGEAHIKVEVSDTGCGIAPTSIKRIFEAYEQEASADSRSFQGIGLGLSVAKGIAQEHGGDIFVDSKVGVGSAFTIVLPCETEEVARKWALEQTQDLPRLEGVVEVAKRKAPAAQQRGEVQHQLQWVCQGGRAPAESAGDQRPLILSVDDDEVNHLVVEMSLGSSYRIKRAMDGYEALEYLRSDHERPAAVLLDIMMPGMTGLSVVQEIRSMLRLTHPIVPVIMLSARAPSEETALMSFECGATDFLAKPFSAPMLLERVRVLCDVRAQCLALKQDPAEPSATPTNAEAEARLACAQEEQRLAEGDAELSAARQESEALREELQRTKDEAERQAESLRREAMCERDAAEQARREAAAATAKASALVDEARQASSECAPGKQEEPARKPREGEDPVPQARSGRSRRPAALPRLASGMQGDTSETKLQPRGEEGLLALAPSVASLKRTGLEQSHCSSSESIPSVAVTDSACDASWLRADLERVLVALSQSQADALTQRYRADSCAREVCFLRSELENMRATVKSFH